MLTEQDVKRIARKVVYYETPTGGLVTPIPVADGGTGTDLSGDTGVLVVDAGVVSAEGQLSIDKSGTGVDLTGETGAVVVDSGTVDVQAQLPVAKGGTGQNLSSTTGNLAVFSGTVRAHTAEVTVQSGDNLQSVANAVAALGGGTVKVVGSVPVTSTFSLPTGVNIVGLGTEFIAATGSALVFSSMSGSAPAVTISNCNNSSLKGVRIVGRSSGAT